MRVKISETAFIAVDGDNGRPYEEVERIRRGKGFTVVVEGDAAALRILLEDLQDRAYHFDADPPSWAAACRKAIPAVQAALTNNERG